MDTSVVCSAVLGVWLGLLVSSWWRFREVATQRAIVKVLRDGDWWYALQLRNRTVRPVSAIYAALERLENIGVVASREEPLEPPPHISIKRRQYRLALMYERDMEFAPGVLS